MIIEKFGFIIGSSFKPDEATSIFFPKEESRYQVVKESDHRGNTLETRYSIFDDQKSYITGFRRRQGGRETTKFHIASIHSSDKQNSFTKLSTLYDTMLKDLISEGINIIDTNCVLKLAYILMKRYGFTSPEGISIRKVRRMQKGLSRFIPVLVIPLEKEI